MTKPRRKKRKKVLTGKVWSGYIGEYKHPPVYIITDVEVDGEDAVFVSGLFREFMRKEVKITIEEI